MGFWGMFVSFEIPFSPIPPLFPQLRPLASRRPFDIIPDYLPI